MSTLGDLHTAFESGQLDPEPFIHFTPRQPFLNVPGIPIIVKFALNDERLLVGFFEGPILVYSTDDLFARTRDSQVCEVQLTVYLLRLGSSPTQSTPFREIQLRYHETSLPIPERVPSW